MFFKGMYRTVHHAGTEFIKNHGSIIVSIVKLEFRLYLCISKQALVFQAKKAGSNHYCMC